MSTNSDSSEPRSFGSTVKNALSSIFGRKSQAENTKTEQAPDTDPIFIPSELYADFVRRAVASDRNHPDRHYTTQSHRSHESREWLSGK